MDILFIHGNFPGQFKHLAAILGSSGEHRVVFLTERSKDECEKFQGVEIINYKNHRTTSNETHHYLRATEECVLRGQAVFREINALINKGFNPRLVITHSGVGIGMFIKDVIPDTIHIGYFEWFFRRETARYLTNETDIDTEIKITTRNHAIWHELDACDIGVVPTQWQKEQFPKEYYEKLEVIFDGIDTNFFRSSNKDVLAEDIEIRNRDTGEVFEIRKGERIMSYATRGMEPLRGFVEFMEGAKAMLHEYSNLNIIVAGNDRRAYSFDAPNKSGSWKEYCLESIEESIRKRIKFVGLLNYKDYRNLLWRSNLHCYFTRPYVTSWSLFEAASCGANMLLNKCEATSNIIEEGTATWVELDNKDSIENGMRRGISQEKRESRILKGYELTTSISKWESLINRLLSNKK